MALGSRLAVSSRVAGVHLLCSLVIAALVGAVVFLAWYPHPYGQLSGGRQLFLILVGVDVVCGPLLTLVLFSPKKPRRENFTDMSLVVLVQIAALVYGVHTAYQARPLFLVHEVDRFRVIAMPDFLGADVQKELAGLESRMRPSLWGGPVTVGIRDPKDSEERHMVMMESLVGGRDYAQRPEFYVPYDAAYGAKVIARAGPMTAFLKQHPDVSSDAARMLDSAGLSSEEALFLPVVHMQDWVAVLDRSAKILGFLPGDGFAVERPAQ